MSVSLILGCTIYLLFKVTRLTRQLAKANNSHNEAIHTLIIKYNELISNKLDMISNKTFDKKIFDHTERNISSALSSALIKQTSTKIL